jgi:hypothetical protein
MSRRVFQPIISECETLQNGMGPDARQSDCHIFARVADHIAFHKNVSWRAVSCRFGGNGLVADPLKSVSTDHHIARCSLDGYPVASIVLEERVLDPDSLGPRTHGGTPEEANAVSTGILEMNTLNSHVRR